MLSKGEPVEPLSNGGRGDACAVRPAGRGPHEAGGEVGGPGGVDDHGSGAPLAEIEAAPAQGLDEPGAVD